MKTDRLQNPRGPLPLASQWSEARGFTRMYGGNPYAQTAFLEAHIGLYKIVWEGWQPNGDNPATPEEIEAAKDHIAGTIRYFSEAFPDWREESFELDSDWGMPTYHANPDLAGWVDWVLEQHPTEESR